MTPKGWDRQVWVLHAMYEADDRPSGLSHDEVHRIELEAGTVEPQVVGDVNLDELPGAVVIGSAVGASADPGEGWRRLRWSELAARLKVDPFDLDVPPCFKSFPYRSWPANIAPPGEGSLDQEQFQSLLNCLAPVSASGWDTNCITYRTPLATGDFNDHTMHRCSLATAQRSLQRALWRTQQHLARRPSMVRLHQLGPLGDQGQRQPDSHRRATRGPRPRNSDAPVLIDRVCGLRLASKAMAGAVRGWWNHSEACQRGGRCVVEP